MTDPKPRTKTEQERDAELEAICADLTAGWALPKEQENYVEFIRRR